MFQYDVSFHKKYRLLLYFKFNHDIHICQLRCASLNKCYTVIFRFADVITITDLALGQQVGQQDTKVTLQRHTAHLVVAIFTV